MNDESPIVVTTLRIIAESKEELQELLQNLTRSNKLFESQYFLNKLKEALSNALFIMEKSSKLIKDLNVLGSAGNEDVVKALEEKLLKTKLRIDAYFFLDTSRKAMECNRLKLEMLRQTETIHSLENKLKCLVVIQKLIGSLISLKRLTKPHRNMWEAKRVKEKL